MLRPEMNYKNMYRNHFCDLCKLHDETNQHLLECHVLISQCPELFNDRVVQYEDIFEDVNKQLRAVQLFEKVLEKRKEILEVQNPDPRNNN